MFAFTKHHPALGRMTLALFVVSASFSSIAFSLSVDVRPPLKSSPTIHLTVFLENNPQLGVKIEIYRYELGAGQELHPRFSLTTDDRGSVLSPVLTDGQYHVVASAPNNMTAELYLDVSQQSQGSVSEFPMHLVRGAPTREELFAQAEQMPIEHRVSSIHGVVLDPTGSPISQVSIEIVQKGSQGKNNVTWLKSESQGYFSFPLHLPDGSYIAHFLASGFQSRFVPFELTEGGSDDLIVTLEVAPSN